MSEPYRIVIAPGVWRGAVVSVEPRTMDRPSRTFRDPAEAEAFAAELSRVEGWPIHDQRGGEGGARP